MRLNVKFLFVAATCILSRKLFIYIYRVAFYYYFLFIFFLQLKCWCSLKFKTYIKSSKRNRACRLNGSQSNEYEKSAFSDVGRKRQTYNVDIHFIKIAQAFFRVRPNTASGDNYTEGSIRSAMIITSVSHKRKNVLWLEKSTRAEHKMYVWTDEREKLAFHRSTMCVWFVVESHAPELFSMRSHSWNEKGFYRRLCTNVHSIQSFFKRL